MEQADLRKMVTDYLNELPEEELEPLEFCNFHGDDTVYIIAPKKILEDSNNPLIERVFAVVKLAEYGCSKNSKTRELETESQCARSTIDIWRHIKFFDKDVTIFQVIKAIGDYVSALGVGECINGKFIADSKLVGHFCTTVHRQVFKHKDNHEDWSLYYNTPSEFGFTLLEFSEV